jgi:DNA helicase-2/ATP-dependent DNA helicase PcrA
VVAPPGSGKTEILVQRIVHLLTTSSGATFRVLALTFTNKAAESLRSRVLQSVVGEEWRLFAGTIHAFCLELLQTYGDPVGVTTSTSIIENEDDRAEALQRGLEDSGYAAEPIDPTVLRRVLDDIDRLKWNLVPPEAAPVQPLPGLNLNLQQAYTAYESALESYGSIDFSGMLFKAHTLLSQDPWIVDHYRSIYKHVLVDEAQDLNFAQYELIKLLWLGSTANVIFVGDRNQAIYRFAGASPKYLEGFKRDFRAQEVALTSNFRSAISVVEAANELSKHITHGSRQVRPMASETGAAGSVEAWEFMTEEAEAAGVANWISNLLVAGLSPDSLHDEEDPSLQAEDICILARTRYALSHVGRALETRGVRYVMRSGELGLFDSRAGQVMHLCLRVLANARDVPSTRRLIRMLNLAEDAEEPDDIAEVLAQLSRSSPLPNAAGEALQRLANGSPLQAAIQSIATAEYPLDGDVPPAEVDLWSSDRDELTLQWRNYSVRAGDTPKTLQAFLRFLSYSQRVSLDDPGVRVLTVHAAKGLEFRAVALVGMNDGMFPYYLSLNDPEELDDERRNAYVAISRAARALRLTRPRLRQTRYGLRQDTPSRFVGEMGLQFVPYEDDIPF